NDRATKRLGFIHKARAYHDFIENGLLYHQRDDRSICTKLVTSECVPSVFAAEALVCLQTLKLGADLGLREVVVEGDSLTMIKKRIPYPVHDGKWKGFVIRLGSVFGQG
ncbi:hypothetical protein Gohar_024805, partial [Gossypium harknessii]|nr:hypothetical protein [Gossypium harknessii]